MVGRRSGAPLDGRHISGLSFCCAARIAKRRNPYDREPPRGVRLQGHAAALDLLDRRARPRNEVVSAVSGGERISALCVHHLHGWRLQSDHPPYGYHSCNAERDGNHFLSEVLHLDRQEESETHRVREVHGRLPGKGKPDSRHRQVLALHALYGHSGEVPSARGQRHAGGQALRDRAGQRRHRRLCSGSTVRTDTRHEISGSGAAKRPRSRDQHGDRRRPPIPVAVSRRLPHGRVPRPRFRKHVLQPATVRQTDRARPCRVSRTSREVMDLDQELPNPQLEGRRALGTVLRGPRGAGQSQCLVASQSCALPHREEGSARSGMEERCQGAH